jgi:hypothetical protein
MAVEMFRGPDHIAILTDGLSIAFQSLSPVPEHDLENNCSDNASIQV